MVGNRLFFAIAYVLLVLRLTILASTLNAQESPLVITPAVAWNSIDSFIDCQAGKEFEIELSEVGKEARQRFLLYVGHELPSSRIYTESTRVDPNGVHWTLHQEQIYGADGLLRVSYEKEEGRPIVAPEHNVRLQSTPVESLKRFGLFPEIYFGYVNTGYELLNLRSKDVRQSFKLLADSSTVALTRSDLHGSLNLEFGNDQIVPRLTRIIVDCEQSTDSRYESEYTEWSGFEFEADGSLKSFRLLSKVKLKAEMIPESLRSKLDDGRFSSELECRVSRVTAWQAEHAPLRFKNIPVPNGFPAAKKDSPGVKYEYHDGELVLVVNQAARELIAAMKVIAEPSKIGNGGFWKSKIDELLAIPQDKRRKSQDEVAGYCGLYSIAAAAAIHGKSIEFPKLLSSTYIQSNLGSTTEELARAISDNGLYCQLVFHASPVYLNNSQSPVLLHLGHSLSSGAPQHWVLFLGRDDSGNAVILDTPLSIESLPFAVLQTHWDGTAIAVSDQPISRVPQYKNWLVGVVPLGFSVLLLSGACLILRRAEASSMTNGFVLMAVIVFGCLIWSLFDSFAYCKNEIPVALTESKVRQELKLDEISELGQLKKEGVLLVDARMPADFALGSMPGAVNLPVNPTLGKLIAVVEQAKQAGHVIVYCQSEECQWSHTVGAKLMTMGIKHVSVFRPGWRGFVEETRVGQAVGGVKD